MATFVVSDKTQKILKNFAGISNSIKLAAGKTQRTLSKGKSVLAIAELPEAWPQDTAIYDLNRFLGTLSIFQKPVITFETDHMVIKGEGGSRIGYRYSDPSTIQSAPNKTLATDSPLAKFTLSEAALEQLSRSCALLELDAVSFIVDGHKVTVGAADAKNPASHTYSIDVPETDIALPTSTSDYQRTLTFSTEHLAMLLTGPYEVTMAAWPYGYFTHKTEPVSYFIVAQAAAGGK
jgi:hypothetical protein